MIFQVVSFSVNLVGDGATKSALVDFANLIKLAGILPQTPSSVYSVSNNYGATATVNGTKVSFTFTTALPTTPTNFSVVLEF